MSMKKLLGVSAAALLLSVEAAHATGPQLSASVQSVGENVATVPTLINYASYIIGVALGVTGISKLKAHVDNPGNTPIKDGLGRVAAAALFISLPYLLTLAQNTSAVGSSPNSYQAIETPTGGF